MDHTQHPFAFRFYRIFPLFLLCASLTTYFLLHETSPYRYFPEEWIAPISESFGDGIKYLARDYMLFGEPFYTYTRALGSLISQPFLLLKGVLAEGFTFYHDDGTNTFIPPLPWVGIAAVFCLLSWRVGGVGLCLLTGFTFCYFAFFGLWQSAMLTFSSIIVAVFLSTVCGILLGLLSYRNPKLNAVLVPLCDIMQTIPLFSYLVPMILFFGFGPIASLIATVVFAMPPMIRVTSQALGETHRSIIELGKMTGCSRMQMNFLILVPAARKKLLLGVNQVIMLSLAVVIIASLIGAGGLGGDVLKALKSLRLGEAIASGIAITLMAVFLDRLSYAVALRRPIHVSKEKSWKYDQHYWLIGINLLLHISVLSYFFPVLHSWPEQFIIPIGSFANDAMDWVSNAYYDQISAFRDTIIIYIMKPVKLFYISLPWLSVVLVFGGLGYWLGGWRLALSIVTILLFIVWLGYWKKAMISLYLVTLSTVFAMLIGFALGVWGAINSKAEKVLIGLVDILQTLPSFVYLIPVVMLFSIGEFPALIAMIAYAIAPAIRYTIFGIKGVKPNLSDAALICGCTPWQQMVYVKLPLALPTILLGLNQTLMMAFGMLVITALVGTRGLEEITLTSIARVEPGDGILAGLAIAGLAIIHERLIKASSSRVSWHLGLQVPKS